MWMEDGSRSRNECGSGVNQTNLQKKTEMPPLN
jgi:hypothetical protein